MKRLNFKSAVILITCASYPLFAQQGWYQLNTGFNLNYYSVHFIDQNTGLACSNSSVIKTTNGGVNWEMYNTGFSAKVADIKMLSTEKAVAICDGGLIIKSTNGGVNWFSVYTSPPGFIYMRNLVFPDTLHGYAVAQTNTVSGRIYRTTNGGDNWIESTTTNCVYVSFASPSTGWIHSSYTITFPTTQFYIAVYKTTNFGVNWTNTYNFNTVSINPGPLFFVNDNIGYKVIQIGSSYFSKTNSGGNSWSNIYAGTNNVNSICFTDQNKGWFVCDNGAILFTSNGGSNFIQQESSVSSRLNSVFFINDSTGWISTSGGKILKTITGGIVSAGNTAGLVPDEFRLYQNYPNPFNPVTVIRYSLIEENVVTLKVFDVQGSEIATLVNEKQNSGTYNYQLSTANYQLSSGIYFYKLTAGEFSDTKRMILLK